MGLFGGGSQGIIAEWASHDLALYQSMSPERVSLLGGSNPQHCVG